MPCPLLIFSQSVYLIQVVDTNLHTYPQTVQIQINWLLQNPTDLDLHCLQRQGISGFSKTRVNEYPCASNECPQHTFLCRNKNHIKTFWFEKSVLSGAMTSILFTPSIGTPYLHTILVLKFEIVHSTTS